MVDIKEVAKKVIADEALAIQNLARFIDDDFEKVVRLIYNTKGRVIVTGIGKSAIIAQNSGYSQFDRYSCCFYACGRRYPR